MVFGFLVYFIGFCWRVCAGPPWPLVLADGLDPGWRREGGQPYSVPLCRVSESSAYQPSYLPVGGPEILSFNFLLGTERGDSGVPGSLALFGQGLVWNGKQIPEPSGVQVGSCLPGVGGEAD